MDTTCPGCGTGPAVCGILQMQGERCCPSCPTKLHPPRSDS